MWPPEPSTDDPQMILLRLISCLRDLDRIDARLPGAYVETAIQHLRSQFDLDEDRSASD
jgi:hypothetical protein